MLSLIAENTEYLDEDYISDNGSILFFTRYDFDVETGTLYIKREEKEPEFIAEGVHLSAQISEDGAMIVFTTNKEECQLHCLYNSCELELPDDITGYYFSRSSNSLAYISSTGGGRELHIMKEDGTPQRVADADAVVGISEDGSCVLYMDNTNVNEFTGDLYAVWDGQKPVFVDKDVQNPYFSEELSRIYPFFEMNEDGSVIVYYKEYHSDSPTADLYVKQRGEQPTMVDERVALGFRLFLIYNEPVGLSVMDGFFSFCPQTRQYVLYKTER